ncbi:ethanolamine utilization protein EutQ [Pilibacter termitis]|uniref:Ethanolamine utilization protein EutQ n=1 Tax=Pilibacter termitis TaxID=263852 RepID=A0A1T4K5S7_9ENTE|nr:cupin domain-containing protein [Pilibacter termitis]SJZ37693.1 ethanolamine utilization protein EutQ [Pilibacter termitis]
MNNLTKETVEKMVREIIMEQFSLSKISDKSGIIKVSLPQVEVTEKDRLDTGNPTDKVYCHDLYTLEESPRLGCGLMQMEASTFPWHLDYDEIDYVIDGTLDIIVDGRVNRVEKGEIIYIPKGSDIEFSVKGKARFMYVTYPADWANQ